MCRSDDCSAQLSSNGLDSDLNFPDRLFVSRWIFNVQIEQVTNGGQKFKRLNGFYAEKSLDKLS